MPDYLGNEIINFVFGQDLRPSCQARLIDGISSITALTNHHMSDPLKTLKNFPLTRMYRGATAEERRDTRRDRLMDAAIDVFSREGFNKTTMSLICGQARIIPRYFYESFVSIEQLFELLHEQFTTQLIETLALSLQTEERDPIKCARIALHAFFVFMQADPRRAKIMLIDGVMDGRVLSSVQSAQGIWCLDAFKDYLQMLYPKAVAVIELDLIVSGLIGMTAYTAATWVKNNFNQPAEVALEYCLFSWSGFHDWLNQLDGSLPDVVPLRLAARLR